ncbi:outer membrane lipoprotein-sorting protein [Bacteroides zoogleoformans]|uniref:Outer membrane lipoprotein-sorting protein n=1 Tax=Bacteroides zoogleoformans TaxID=28119 RepID=A0ABM6T718_9BACE|nr:outer membrane lipoprotein-sorting protein [Bacteroides zoogleoformans]AVM52505.1 outer membrane lipoprotein-sorting protein [Bacteroides zoogleoformans]TWJ14215.1 outer membrane lipoprotein-sorting protein [Bacteroides zoogleoformans]
MRRFILMAATAVVFTASAIAQTGREIAQKVKDRPDGYTRQSELTMKLVNKRGAVRERKLISYSIDVGKEKKDRKSIMFFQYPGDVKGTGFLTWDYDDPNKDDDKWLYLPAMKKTRRISGSSAKQDYFMGSDFTYDDMGSRNVDEDTHKLLGEETIGGYKCWKLESTPKDKRDIYSKKTALIRQDCLIPVRVEFYDKIGKLHRRLEISDIAKVEGFWTARKMHMTNVQTEHQTILEIKNPKYNIPIEETGFNVTTLEKGRF